MHPRCIKCSGQHATRDCTIKEKIEEPTCINCGEKGHLAAWKGCKALPLIQKTSIRKPCKTCAASSKSRKEEEPEIINAEKTTDMATEVSDLKDSLEALKEVKTLLQEFPTLLEAVRQCRHAKSRQEKVLIVLNALVGI
ncbi:hypothetical protein AVEN_220457-1 [Araneus ventricosus]|uniref:CCHC-type domain-containing protein n=1 Tax=Araneus ventricosus TaxID=182803 RepID=A0A4Y2QCJ6_ARAVE|nr:hypothetical protein AVEN_220457-1 [Araneus ventricosus]